MGRTFLSVRNKKERPGLEHRPLSRLARNNGKKSLIISLVSFFLLAMPVLAQAENVQTSSTNTTSGSDSGAQADFYSNSTSNYAQQTASPTAPAFVTASPCMGVMSGAGTSPVVGIALGMSYKDKECEDRANASALNSLGDRAAAMQVMCQIDSVKNAMAAAGTPCSGIVATSQTMATAPQEQTMQADALAGPGYVKAGGGVTPLQQFCSSLNPKKSEDRPYLESECKSAQ